MSVAAAIEIGAGGFPGIGEAGSAGTKTGILGAEGAMPSSPEASGATSFRSNWQTFLESLKGEPGLTDATAAGGEDADSSFHLASERLAPPSRTGIESTGVRIAGDRPSSVQNPLFDAEFGTAVNAPINARAWIESGAPLHGSQGSQGVSPATSVADSREAQASQTTRQTHGKHDKTNSGRGACSQTPKPSLLIELQSVVAQGVTATQPENLPQCRNETSKSGPLRGPSSSEGQPADTFSRPKEDASIADKSQFQRPGSGALNGAADSGSKDEMSVSENGNDAVVAPTGNQPLQSADVSVEREGPLSGTPGTNPAPSNFADTALPLGSRTGASRSGRASDPLQDRGPQRIQDSSTVKAAHSTGSGGVAGDTSTLSSWHPESGLQDAIGPAFVRDPSGMPGDGDRQGSAANLAGRVTDATAQSGQDAFAALDAERTTPSATWTHAGAHHAEAGYLDPSLGWVSVRADVAGSGVHAAVVPGSAEAAQALSGHFTGLNAYLAEHHVQSATVTMAAPENGHEGAGLGQERGFGNHDGTNDGAGRRQGADSGRPGDLSSGTMLSRPAVSLAVSAEVATPSAGGNYISVMA
jgi:hypothetical protein